MGWDRAKLASSRDDSQLGQQAETKHLSWPAQGMALKKKSAAKDKGCLQWLTKYGFLTPHKLEMQTEGT